MSPGSYASIRLPTLTVPRICEKVIPRICRETFPAVRPQALLWIENGRSASMNSCEKIHSSICSDAPVQYWIAIQIPVREPTMEQLFIKIRRIVPVPTPIRTALQTVVRTQLVMVMFSQTGSAMPWSALARIAMQSSPVSMIQSLTVTLRQESRSNPSPFGVAIGLTMRTQLDIGDRHVPAAAQKEHLPGTPGDRLIGADQVGGQFIKCTPIAVDPAAAPDGDVATAVRNQEMGAGNRLGRVDVIRRSKIIRIVIPAVRTG